jgi:uncharacterized protein (TIGR02677 family)
MTEPGEAAEPGETEPGVTEPGGTEPGGTEPGGTEPAAGPERGRLLFRYLGGDEWREYRAILGVFAGTCFAEFTPDEIADRLRPATAGDQAVDPGVVPDRLESLRRWGNLTLSTSVGNPSSLDDYYRRRNRYLITREGQEVHDLVEGVLQRVDEVRELQAGRLRDVLRALERLAAIVRGGLAGVAPTELADAVRAVFDPHESFTIEITQFFAALNQWQSRYDLEPDQLQFFAEVLVGYVSEQLAEIERAARPIARTIGELEPALDTLLGRLEGGLASRVDDAGLGERITVRRVAGSSRADWAHLASWFSAPPGRRSRLDELTRQALSAVRTLTANLTRLSGIGLGSASRRADFVRLARFLAAAPTVDDAHDLAAAAFGLGPARHLGLVSGDADDPAPTTTPWAEAERAVVPVSLRQRGEVTNRGRPTPIRDRSTERELLRRNRERQAAAERRTAAELLAACGDGGAVDGAQLSSAAFVRLRDLIGRTSHRAGAANERSASDTNLTCLVRRRRGAVTTVTSPEGRLRLIDLDVRIVPLGTSDAARVAAGEVVGEVVG